MSLAEIFAVLGDGANLISYLDNFAVFELKDEFAHLKILSVLGGVVKFGKVIEQDIGERDVADKMFYQLARQTKKDKLFFGISVYDRVGLNVKDLGMALKKRLKEEGISSRFVVSRERNLSSVVVKTNKLLTPCGAEFVLFYDGKKLFLGKTLAVQEFEEYEKRDFPRPARSMIRGMLPPKLARIMVNLSQTPKDGVILDPFCGAGTILSEAAILGYKNLIGSDSDKEAVEATEKNIDWLKQNFQFSIFNFQLFNIDARKISKQFKAQTIDAVVTEPFLGPPLKGNEPPEKINQLANLLKNLYLESFREFKKILKPGGKMVFVLPMFRLNNKSVSLDMKNELKKMGFQIQNFLPPPIGDLVKKEIGLNGGFIYGRPDQRVWREVVVFRL